MNVSVKRYSDVKVDKREVLRYAGVSDGDSVYAKCVEEAVAEFNGKEKFAVCYATFPVSVKADLVDFSLFSVNSKNLASHLKDCKSAVIFVATIGFEIDRLIRKYSSVSISKALCFNALGTERVESLCNKFCEDLKKEVLPLRTTWRFSPGYGDLPLETQERIFDILNCEKNIGVMLNDSLLMSPSKSVSAIVGIGEKDCANQSGCQSCEKKDCEFRG